MTNTFDAHRLVHLGAAHGIHDAVKERLFDAHLVEGEWLGDTATLRRLGVEAGLPGWERQASVSVAVGGEAGGPDGC